MLIPVILSGGAGTRLWPVSRKAYPKPFMQMGDGESLLVKTLKRAQAVAVGEEVVTVTARDHFFITRDEYRGLLADQDARFLLEPVGRNTAPALAMAALDIEHRHGPDAQMLVLPADHLIRDLDSYAQAVGQALANIDRGLERMQAVRGYAGELLNRADRITGNQETRSNQLEGDRSRAEDLDMIKGISDFQNQQVGYEAALKSYSMVQKMSLFNFIS